ncbi:hypothetical protein CBS101457_005775 [Exobasidium rhododendri]|nr:hypothetical protein CBS101457_005775 [Exobasidium rhododendri]
MAARFTPRLAQQATRSYASQAAIRPPIPLHGLPGKYASSAFVAAANKDAKTLDLVEKDLKALKQLLHPSSSTAEAKKLRDFIANPTLSGADKTKTLNEIVGGKEAEITKNLFSALADHGRLGETEKVIDGFLELMSAHRGEVEVIVTSASPLDKSTSSRLEAAIKGSQYASKGKSVKIVQKVNPALQGGLVVDFGERSIDLSVSSRVNRLNTLLQQSV